MSERQTFKLNMQHVITHQEFQTQLAKLELDYELGNETVNKGIQPNNSNSVLLVNGISDKVMIKLNKLRISILRVSLIKAMWYQVITLKSKFC